MKILGGSLITLFVTSILSVALAGPKPSTSDATPKFTWTRGIMQLGAENFTKSYGVATDQTGNVYVAGSFNGEISFGTTNLVKIQSGDLFFEDSYLAKLSPGGDLLWVKQGTVPDNHVLGLDVVCDKAGNAYFLGGIFLGGNFGDASFTNIYGSVIMKYNPKGKLLWTRVAHGTERTRMILDKDENVLLTGMVVFGADFGNGITVPPIADYQFFVAKYDGLGNPLWVRSHTADNTALSCTTGIAAGPNGDVYVLGRFWGEAHFDENTTLSSSTSDLFIVRYGADGSLKWAKQSYGIGDLWTGPIAVDENNRVYIAGSYMGMGSIGELSLPYATDSMFLGSIDSAGNVNWLQSLAGGMPASIVVESSSRIHLTGAFHGAMQLGQQQLVSLGAYDCFWASFNAAGSFGPTVQFGGMSDEGVTAMTIDSKKDIILTGQFAGNASFGSHVLSSPICSSVFISRLSTASGKK